ncbi:MAG: CBS domain-containing protein [Candidatus Helarchaeales archaeon]
MVPQTSFEYKTVKQIMTKEIRTANAFDSIYDVAKIMIDHGVEIVLITFNNKHVGVVTMQDLFKVLIDLDKITHDIRQINIREIMSPIISINENATLEEAAKIFSENKITRLPVMTKKDQPVGVITIDDVIATRPDIYQKIINIIGIYIFQIDKKKKTVHQIYSLLEKSLKIDAEPQVTQFIEEADDLSYKIIEDEQTGYKIILLMHEQIVGVLVVNIVTKDVKINFKLCLDEFVKVYPVAFKKFQSGDLRAFRDIDAIVEKYFEPYVRLYKIETDELE